MDASAPPPTDVLVYHGESYSFEGSTSSASWMNARRLPNGDILLEGGAGSARLKTTDGQVFEGRWQQGRGSSAEVGPCKFDVFLRNDRLTLVGHYTYDSRGGQVLEFPWMITADLT